MRRWLLPALVALLVLIAPRPALAHADHGEESKNPAPASSSHAAPSCPDAPGHPCGCGNLVPCSSAEAAGIAGASSLVLCACGAAEAAFEAPEAPAASNRYSPAHPRAPPRFS
jgi:hypothetical protein